MTYSYLDHTADTGVSATGGTLAETVAALVEGLAAFLCDPEQVLEVESREIAVESTALESLIVDFLSEINFVFEVERFAFRRFEVLELDRTHIRARGFGEPIDPDRHELGPQVKAVTYHGLEIDDTPGACRIQVVLDI